MKSMVMHWHREGRWIESPMMCNNPSPDLYPSYNPQHFHLLSTNLTNLRSKWVNVGNWRSWLEMDSLQMKKIRNKNNHHCRATSSCSSACQQQRENDEVHLPLGAHHRDHTFDHEACRVYATSQKFQVEPTCAHGLTGSSLQPFYTLSGICTPTLLI